MRSWRRRANRRSRRDSRSRHDVRRDTRCPPARRRPGRLDADDDSGALPGYTIINRGIDSFTTADLVAFADRLVIRYRPRLIVLHVGGNDINGGKPPAMVLADFQAFVAKVRAALPEVPIAFSSITPGPGRWDQAARREAANAAVQAWMATRPGLSFIDLWDAMLTSDGRGTTCGWTTASTPITPATWCGFGS